MDYSQFSRTPGYVGALHKAVTFLMNNANLL